MESCRALALCAVAAALLLGARGQGQPPLRRARDLGPPGGGGGGGGGGGEGGGGASREKELIEALQEVLEKLRGRELPAAKTKLGRVPSCLPREPCAVRMGARFGTRCSCPPGTACNLHVLECS